MQVLEFRETSIVSAVPLVTPYALSFWQICDLNRTCLLFSPFLTRTTIIRKQKMVVVACGDGCNSADNLNFANPFYFLRRQKCTRLMMITMCPTSNTLQLQL